MFVFIPLFKPSASSIGYDICLLMSRSIVLETI